MARINLEEEWKEALELLESTLEQWEEVAIYRNRLHAGELEIINAAVEDIKHFVAVHSKNIVNLLEFYDKLERVAMTLYFASIKMKNR